MDTLRLFSKTPVKPYPYQTMNDEWLSTVKHFAAFTKEVMMFSKVTCGALPSSFISKERIRDQIDFTAFTLCHSLPQRVRYMTQSFRY